MPGQYIDQPNPPPEASNLPKDVLHLSVRLDYENSLPENDRKAISQFRRAGDYLAAGESSFLSFQ